MSRPDFVWPVLDHAASESQHLEARRQQAIDEGYAAGHSKGLAAAEAELAVQYQHLADALALLDRHCCWLQEANAESLHAMVSSVLTSVLDVELSSNGDVYRNFLERGIASLAGTTPRVQSNASTRERLNVLGVSPEKYELDIEETLPDGALRLVTKNAMVVFDPREELARLLADSEPAGTDDRVDEGSIDSTDVSA